MKVSVKFDRSICNDVAHASFAALLTSTSVNRSTCKLSEGSGSRRSSVSRTNKFRLYVCDTISEELEESRHFNKLRKIQGRVQFNKPGNLSNEKEEIKELCVSEA